jgi:hypothetical protein
MPPTPYFTTDAFRDLTRVKKTRLGIDVSQEALGEALLQTELDRAATYVEIVTGQPATDTDGVLIPPSMATAENPVSDVVLRTLIGQAVQMRCEQVLFQAQNGYVDDATDDVVASLSVGGFSQSKVDSTRRGEQRSLNSWRALADLLWLIMTFERYCYWIVVIGGAAGAGAQMPPSWSFENMLWPDAGSLLGGGFGWGGGWGNVGVLPGSGGGWTEGVNDPWWDE